METAESGTLAEPTAEMDADAPHSPARDAREEEPAPQGSSAHAHTPAGRAWGSRPDLRHRRPRGPWRAVARR